MQTEHTKRHNPENDGGLEDKQRNSRENTLGEERNVSWGKLKGHRSHQKDTKENKMIVEEPQPWRLRPEK